jgi:hypothetical protein
MYNSNISLYENFKQLIEKDISEEYFIYNFVYLVKLGFDINTYIDNEHLLYYLCDFIEVKKLPIFFILDLNWENSITKESDISLKNYFKYDYTFIKKCKSMQFLIYNFDSEIVKNTLIILDNIDVSLTNNTDVIFSIKWKSDNLWRKSNCAMSEKQLFKYGVIYNNLTVVSDLFSYDYVENHMIPDVILNNKIKILIFFIYKGIILSKYDLENIDEKYKNYIKQIYTMKRILKDANYYYYLQSIIDPYILNNPHLINKEYIKNFRKIQKKEIENRYEDKVNIMNNKNFLGDNIFNYTANNIITYEEESNVWCFNYYEYMKMENDVNPYTGKKFEKELFIPNKPKYNVNISEVKKELTDGIKFEDQDINDIRRYKEELNNTQEELNNLILLVME